MSQDLSARMRTLFFLLFLALSGCPSGGDGGNTAEPVEDTATADIVSDANVTDTAAPSDTAAPEDTVAPIDAPQPTDTATPDTVLPEDVLVPEDISPEDTIQLTDTTSEDTQEEDVAAADTVTGEPPLPDGCSDPTPKESISIAAGTTTLSVTYDNQGVDSTRKVVIQAPSPLPDMALPVLFFFHGSGGGTNGTVNQCKKAQQSGLNLICIAPQGAAQIESGKPGWNLGSGQTAEDDLTFIRTLWNAIKEDAHVDTEQVFAGGSSMGGAFTANVLSVDVCTNFLKGHAHVASTMWKDTVIKSQGLQSVVIIHGEDDGLIPIDGGPAFGGSLNFLSVEEALGQWASHNGCDVPGEPQVEKEEMITRISYPSCPVPMVVYRLNGVGHSANVQGWYGANNMAFLFEIFVNKTLP